ncbi:MAG TPA: HU family DNA-binding protein [bacterium]|nr:HU family DNA-binding protein [bacterium]
MTKKEIIDMVAERTGQKHSHTKAVVEQVLEVFIDKLAEEGRIEIRNFGVFKVKRTPARIGRNPKTREVAPVPARNIIQFKAGKTMKERVNVQQDDAE